MQRQNIAMLGTDTCLCRSHRLTDHNDEFTELVIRECPQLRNIVATKQIEFLKVVKLNFENSVNLYCSCGLCRELYMPYLKCGSWFSLA